MNLWTPQIFEPTQKPEPGFDAIDWDAPISQGLISSWLLNQASGTSAKSITDTVAQNNLTTIAAPTWVGGKSGPAFAFNGTSQAASTPTLLPGYKALSFAYRLWVNAYSNGNGLPLEMSTNYNLVNNGFVINADTASGLNAGMHEAGGYAAMNFSKPSAGAWHDYVVVFNKAGTTIASQVQLFVDGVNQVGSIANSVLQTGTLGANPLYLMSRATTSLFLAGKLEYFHLWGRALNATEAALLYSDPYAMIARPSLSHEAATARALLLERRRRMLAA